MQVQTIQYITMETSTMQLNTVEFEPTEPNTIIQSHAKELNTMQPISQYYSVKIYYRGSEKFYRLLANQF